MRNQSNSIAGKIHRRQINTLRLIKKINTLKNILLHFLAIVNH